VQLKYIAGEGGSAHLGKIGPASMPMCSQHVASANTVQLLIKALSSCHTRAAPLSWAKPFLGQSLSSLGNKQ